MKTENQILDALQTIKKIIDDTPEDKLKAITETYGDIQGKINSAISILQEEKECEHSFEPYYNYCSELQGYICEYCGVEKD